MNKIVLDFSEIKTWWELHEYFKEIFGLPEYYGKNLDALWDCLRCSFEEDTLITLIDLQKLPGPAASEVDGIKELFMDLEREEREVTVEFIERRTKDNSN